MTDTTKLPQGVEVYGPHPVLGTLKDRWQWWRILEHQIWKRARRQVSNDREDWEYAD